MCLSVFNARVCVAGSASPYAADGCYFCVPCKISHEKFYASRKDWVEKPVALM